MSETMKTAVFRDVKKIELETCDKPGAAGNKILVKIDASAICTWEQRVYTGVNKVEFPFIGGHEIFATMSSDEFKKDKHYPKKNFFHGICLFCFR